MPKKHSFQEVFNYFKEKNLILLETEYKDIHTKMKYQCNFCGDISYITFQDLKRTTNNCKNSNCKNYRYNSQRFDYEYVKNYFEDYNCKLLEDRYINNNTKMRYICKNGHEGCVTFASFKANNGNCKQCANEKLSEDRNLSYGYVKQFFEDYNCELLEDRYINNSTKMKFRCYCGRESVIAFRDFRLVKRCQMCGEDIRAIKRKHDFQYIKEKFEEFNCKLLEFEYLGCYQSLHFKCHCGNIEIMTYINFLESKQCHQCNKQHVKDLKKLSIEFVKKQFLLNGCKLLENVYINNHTLIKYRCECGNVDFITYNAFQYGERCNKCKPERISKSLKENGNLKPKYGSDHPNWNSNLTDEERQKNRDILENEIWRKEVFERDNYTCQICEQHGKKLCAHHLDGYHWAIDKRFDVNNGITLCKDCHKEFHHIFGYKNNTEKQFILFKNNQINIKQEMG